MGAEEVFGSGYRQVWQGPLVEDPGLHIRVSQIAELTAGGQVGVTTWLGAMDGALFVESQRRLARITAG